MSTYNSSGLSDVQVWFREWPQLLWCLALAPLLTIDLSFVAVAHEQEDSATDKGETFKIVHQ